MQEGGEITLSESERIATAKDGVALDLMRTELGFSELTMNSTAAKILEAVNARRKLGETDSEIVQITPNSTMQESQTLENDTIRQDSLLENQSSDDKITLDETKPVVENPFADETERTLKANVRYTSGEYNYRYETDGKGRVCTVLAEKLQIRKRRERLRHIRETFGKLTGDHAGHLIGDRFGGSEKLDNLVSQLAKVNLSDYKKLENQWANALKAGQEVRVDIQIQYEGDNMRPSEFVVTQRVAGIEKVTKISNVQEAMK